MRVTTVPNRWASKEELERLLDRARALFEERGEIMCAYVFGSCARGTSSRLSDLDLAVFTRRSSSSIRECWRTYWGDLHAELVRALGLRDDDIDLLILDEVEDPVMRHRATWHGRLIFCRCHEDRVKLEAEILQRYLDLAHLRKTEERALLGWASRSEGASSGT